MSRAARSPVALRAGAIVLLAVLAAELAVTAWQSDDAYITFRTVDNLFTGHGLRWNADERVQSYTHPLWLLLAVGCRAIAGELYVSTLLLGALLTLAAAAGLLRLNTATPLAGLALLLVLVGSKAFVDYGTSGLENPLTGLLLVLLAGRLAAPKPWIWVPLLAALLALTRPDALLLALPAVLFSLAALRGQPRRRWLAWGLAWTPLVLWELFSLAYYGSAIPNTAWAKLNLDVGPALLVPRGLVYLADSLGRDPVTLLATLTGGVVGLLGPRREGRLLAAGVLLYLGYVVWIGGDFMSGRFLTAPLVGSLGAMSAQLVSSGRRVRPALLAAVVALALYAALWPGSPLRSGSDYGASGLPAVAPTGIADERAYYYPTTGALKVIPALDELERNRLPVPPYRGALHALEFRAAEEQATLYAEVGFFGFFAGPGKRVVDVWALCDPLLSRIPFRPRAGFRIGHYPRGLPEGYLRSREQSANLLVDPALRRAYDDILLVVRGPLWTAARWRAIWRLHAGVHRPAFDRAAASAALAAPFTGGQRLEPRQLLAGVEVE